MRKPKFKVGDRVKVLREPSSDEGWGDCWVPEMTDTIGRVLTVDCVYSYGYRVHLYALYPISLRYPEFVLQNDMWVGQQLLFSFMGE